MYRNNEPIPEELKYPGWETDKQRKWKKFINALNSIQI
jgi:hypothetical protein